MIVSEVITYNKCNNVCTRSVFVMIGGLHFFTSEMHPVSDYSYVLVQLSLSILIVCAMYGKNVGLVIDGYA